MANSTIIKKVAEELKRNQKSLDDIQQHIWDVIILNQLTNEQVAALFTSLMRETLMQPHNQKLLKQLNVGAETLDPKLVTLIQKILTENWLRTNL